ncbi:hypothetical protein [Actinoplanes sp. RD1]|uniref:hypothetical protein n=1 Tax=Actinoplanes sp. RD1 TaxID=3064538 RepID=UPI00274113ED|nr:hypothetical protein [Actinoplanes sp. RD1]
MISRLIWAGVWALFVVGIANCIGSSFVFDGLFQTIATYGGLVVSLITGTLIARNEPVKSFLGTKPVMWFLFLFNLAAAIIVLITVDGVPGISATAGLGLVSLGAGSGLLLSARRPAKPTVAE